MTLTPDQVLRLLQTRTRPSRASHRLDWLAFHLDFVLCPVLLVALIATAVVLS